MDLMHIIKAQQFDRQFMEELFELADNLEKFAGNGTSNILHDKIMAALFYMPSTRTRLSFESAMIRLGGHVISTENAREFSSVAKGETLEDSIRVISQYCDVVVLRHNEVGAAERAAEVSDVPVINAGDGPGQHPTQALLDVFTIQKELGQVDGIQIAMVGDLANGRTVRSLAYLLSKFEGIKIYFVSPSLVAMKHDIKDHLRENNVEFVDEPDLLAVAREVDVLYQTRIQKECFADKAEDYNIVSGRYIVDETVMAVMQRHAIVMHPLPRVGEIAVVVDADPRAAYFRQAKNGLVIRMALLCMIFQCQ